MGLGALVTGWPYLTEVLGDAGIPIGSTVESMTAALDALDADVIARAREASVRRRDAYGWDAVGARTRELYETVLARSRFRSRRA